MTVSTSEDIKGCRYFQGELHCIDFDKIHFPFQQPYKDIEVLNFIKLIFKKITIDKTFSKLRLRLKNSLTKVTSKLLNFEKITIEKVKLKTLDFNTTYCNFIALRD